MLERDVVRAMSSINKAIALRLARASLPVFPACPDTKRPLVRFTAAATRLERGVDYHWGRHPKAVPAIHLAGAGLVVNDLDRGHGDGADGVAQLEKLLDAHGELPACCPMVRTPRGGVHIYFQQPDDAEPIGNSVGQVAPGVDIRGWHGFVVAPGAVMASGEFYEGIAGTPDLCESFIAGAIPTIPAWLTKLAEKPAYLTAPARGPFSPAIESNRSPYGIAILEGEARALAATPAPYRNKTLNKAAFVVASKAGAWNFVSEENTWAALWAACVSNGYIQDDGAKAFKHTFYSGWNDGLADPTPPPDRLTADPAIAARFINLKPRSAQSFKKFGANKQ
jgi:hypothetical protein